MVLENRTCGGACSFIAVHKEPGDDVTQVNNIKKKGHINTVAGLMSM